jgi:hypothetical protein
VALFLSSGEDPRGPRRGAKGSCGTPWTPRVSSPDRHGRRRRARRRGGEVLGGDAVLRLAFSGVFVSETDPPNVFAVAAVWS